MKGRIMTAGFMCQETICLGCDGQHGNVGVGTGPWWSAGNCVSDTAAGAGRPADNWDNASAIIRGAGARFVLHDHVDHIEILSPPIHQMLIDSLKGKWWSLQCF